MKNTTGSSKSATIEIILQDTKAKEMMQEMVRLSTTKGWKKTNLIAALKEVWSEEEKKSNIAFELEGTHEKFKEQAQRFTDYYKKEIIKMVKTVYDKDNGGVPTTFVSIDNYVSCELVEFMTAAYILLEQEESINVKTIIRCIKEYFDASFSDAEIRRKLRLLDTLVVSMDLPKEQDGKPRVTNRGKDILQVGVFSDSSYFRYWDIHCPRYSSQLETVIRFTWVVRRYF